MANAEVDVVDYEDEDMEDAVEVDAPKLRSAVTDSSSAPLKTKGRGFREAMTTEAERNTRFASKDFDSLASDGGGPAAQRSQSAISAMNGAELLTQIISVDWAFSNGPFKQRNTRRRSPRGHRSRSPRRRF
ncbi:hypothetical protein C5167_003229 [Papaver somniferum]|uniref:Uncharacterized protein n=1 Tax=Papaver somniferum TaxID=3469 RepID=A0A4Y7L0D6_PAPSO|nr:hypothetical protein C5167_003229 [Papaver somniferum]